jgi:hypothetical protein
MLRPPWVVISASATPLESTRWAMMSRAFSNCPALTAAFGSASTGSSTIWVPPSRSRPSLGLNCPVPQRLTEKMSTEERDDDRREGPQGATGPARPGVQCHEVPSLALGIGASAGPLLDDGAAPDVTTASTARRSNLTTTPGATSRWISESVSAVTRPKRPEVVRTSGHRQRSMPASPAWRGPACAGRGRCRR